MSIEQDVVDLLAPLFGTRVWWQTTPDDFGNDQESNFVILSDMGGVENWYVDNTLPDHRNMYLRIRGFSRDAQRAQDNGRAISRLLAGSGIVCRPQGAANSIYDEGGKYHGTLQHFALWYKDDVT